ncbi:MAG TPA: serine/threonine protein kinase [Cyanobacteria bacterium UBA11149]|nr:serine/threonine protein kinase [Cyanobacteria bacterium UBA11367]HBE60006.1 serine/threonine protein kinase [Cyanobacteria bacterium UBA11366]HBK63843.1 serine/threonine protein kinase [Cyanobacteria bacterium UBA11166]HBR73865.1 serine/threonine protein kinase [Cyanobacteria bacterium UBA11159]HBS70084.1 serine/threonine protein kinase [Cyanobacteria bacterium UBA11153]HBW89639.1 serine/threonine protein kinase [Cyanobacteria bacterium UBA11149]HCA97390.1 serine/threonine protein kinase 
MTWLVGQKLHDGRYAIERELGRGYFSITYLVSDRDRKRLVIKTLSDDLLGQLNSSEIDLIQEQFLQEAVRLAKCKHPHIVQIKEPFLEDNQVCILMEYVDGVDLATRARERLPEAEALRYIQQIGEALKVVHANGLVHRYVKPENILVRNSKDEAVLIDFGLARGADHPLSSLDANTGDGFDAIELYHHVDGKLGDYTDIYSLAGTLYFLLTGVVPPTAMERSQGRERLTAPKQINPEISDRTNEAILTGMALAGEDRPQTIQDWLDILGVQRQVSRSRQSGNSIAWLVVIGALLAVLGSMAAWFIFKPPQSPKPTDNPKSQLIQPRGDFLVNKLPESR